MKKTKLFKNGQSQAVRLPREFRFKGKEVLVRRVRNGVILLSEEAGWQSLVESLSLFSDDFLSDRKQPFPSRF